MTPEQVERRRERNRVANLTPEQIERRREQGRARRANMTPEQLERRRERRREQYRSMPPEQRERELERNRQKARRYRANMTPEQIELERARKGACPRGPERDRKRRWNSDIDAFATVSRCTRWTEDEDTAVLAWSGPITDLAILLGRTYDSVAHRRRRLLARLIEA